MGVGKCRQYEGGVMCPSFRATREEEHSTRGRAHLLWEMTRGDVVRDQWRDSGCEVVARSLSVVQGLQKRLPGRRGCRNLQGGVPVASLRRQAAAAESLRVRPHRPVGADGVGRFRALRISSPRLRACESDCEIAGGGFVATDYSRLRPHQLPKLVCGAETREFRGPAGCAVAGYLQ